MLTICLNFISEIIILPPPPPRSLFNYFPPSPFCLHNSQSPVALGNAGSGLGYEGIFNSLAVEIDTYFNYDNLDYYENHVSVMTQGWRYNISANHSRSLATTNRIPDLTDAKHTIKLKYDPNFDENAVPHPSFQVNGYTSWFLENADFMYGGEGDWGTGVGLLKVYVDDMVGAGLLLS